MTICGQSSIFKAPNIRWRKWRTSDPTSAHWYRLEDLAGLIAANLHAGRRPTVRDFIAEFDGLAGTQYRRRVVPEAGLDGCDISCFVADGELNMERIAHLLEAMRRNSRPVKPDRLGIIGRENFRSAAVAYGVDPQSFQCAKAVKVGDDGLPFVVEVGFAVGRNARKLLFGLSNSPVFRVPSADLNRILSDCHVQADDPIVLLVHQASPRFAFVGHGKGGAVA